MNWYILQSFLVKGRQVKKSLSKEQATVCNSFLFIQQTILKEKCVNNTK